MAKCQEKILYERPYGGGHLREALSSTQYVLVSFHNLWYTQPTYQSAHQV